MNYKSIAKSIKTCQKNFSVREINGVSYLFIKDEVGAYLTQRDSKNFKEFLDKDSQKFFEDINLLKKYNLNQQKWIEFINSTCNSINKAIKSEDKSIKESIPYLKALLEVLRDQI